MNLVIDIGNTQTKLAWFDQGRILQTARIPADESDGFNSILHEKEAPNVIISSVKPLNENILNEISKSRKQVIQLDYKTSLPLEIIYNSPQTLGHDRIAAAAGARYVCPFCNVMIIDMGTAITIDFVSSEGKYMGGNISPGMQTRFRALNEFTAQLPLVNKDPDFPLFGSDTRTAIVSGVQQGIIYEINSYIEEYTKLYPACEFIITGGDADFFVSRLKKSIFAIPDLVLKGLNYILEYNLLGKKI